VAQTEIGGQGIDERLAVLRAKIARLLEFDDMSHELPVGLRDVCIDSLQGSEFPCDIRGRDLAKQTLILSVRPTSRPRLNDLDVANQLGRIAAIAGRRSLVLELPLQGGFNGPRKQLQPLLWCESR